MKKFFYFLALLGLVLSPFSFSFRVFSGHAEVLLDEQPYLLISEDTNWELADSPFVLRSTVLVDAGARLTIEPGVVVKMEGDLIVYGELFAGEQSAQQRVYFTSVYDDAHGGDQSGWSDQAPASGDWGAIEVYGGGRAEFYNTRISYGGERRIFMVREPFLKRNTAHAASVQVGALNCLEGSSIVIADSLFEFNKIGIALNSPQLFQIEDSIIKDNGTGLASYGEEELAALGLHWGDTSGPYHAELNPQGEGDVVSGNVAFDPWFGKEVELEYKDPIIIIPGIVASVLESGSSEEEVWPNILEMMIPGEDEFLRELSLSSEGLPDTLIKNNMEASDIFRTIVSSDFFSGLIFELEKLGYMENHDLFVFPYDWRYSVEWSAGDPPIEMANLKDKIEAVLRHTGKEKVHLLAHSMGGLVAKSYLSRFGSDSVDMFVDIATPHLGAPKAFKVLTFGDDMGFQVFDYTVLNEKTVQEISQNFPAIYELLPSEGYFTDRPLAEAAFIADPYDIQGNGNSGDLELGASRDLMMAMGRNAEMLENARTTHQNLDDFNYEKTINIVSCGFPTIGKVYILREEAGERKYGIRYIDGDGTVPFASADHLEAPTVYTNVREHAFLPSADGVKELIAAFFDEASGGFFFDGNPGISLNSEEVCGISGAQASFHSPIELHIVDSENRHLGPNEEGGIDLQIPGAAYDILDGNKFAFLPDAQGMKIFGRAEGAGEFDARFSIVENGEYLATADFYNIALSASTSVELVWSDDLEELRLRLDRDGDFVFEDEYAPDFIGEGYPEPESSPEYGLADIPALIEEYSLRGEIEPGAGRVLQNRIKSILKQQEQADALVRRLGEKSATWNEKGEIMQRAVQWMDRKAEKLDETNERILALRLERLLESVERFYKQEKLSEEFYVIIKNILIK